MAVPKIFKVGIIIGSQRVIRVGPQITTFVADTIKAHQDKQKATPTTPQISYELIDLTTQNLPLFNEPIIPGHIHDPSGYHHEHTRAWSARISALDAFVFVTPQHNWGIPAGLKNALDYLFNEWKGKPAMVVSYGGHGGGQCAQALKVVLGGGLKMRVAERTVNMSFPGPEFRDKAFRGEGLGLDAANDQAPWAEKRGEIEEVWDEMVKMLGEEK